MDIGILGSGRMGRALGRLWSRAGHRVGYAYAREQSRLERYAREDGAPAWWGSVGSVAAQSSVLLLAVTWDRIDDVLTQADRIADKTLISCSLPLTSNDTELVFGPNTSGAEQLQDRLPTTRVVSAFGTLPSELLGAIVSRVPTRPPHVLVSTDSDDAKSIAFQLGRDAGLQGIDAGSLSAARLMEPFALLVAKLAYERGSNPAVSYAFERI